jgi:methyl-accepting chemotaxis protein
MKESVNATGEALHDALEQVSQAVDQVSSASAQIAASSQAVASGASEQASSLTETSSSVLSVAEQATHTAESAQQANQLSQQALTAATDGAAAVVQLQSAMGKIKQSAEGTSQIIRDVSDIAFQTNLLALNAAVEAARAGEAGRGFAVVAEEVRSLALRAKDAASKTEELIRQSVKQAGEGEVAAKHVAGKLTEILQGVSKVTAIASEIAASAKEQTTGIGQVNQALSEMDKVTQQNAASAEESSSAASELSGQAEELAAMVSSFRLFRQSSRGSMDSREAARLPPPAMTLRKLYGALPHTTQARPPREAEFPINAEETRDL